MSRPSRAATAPLTMTLDKVTLRLTALAKVEVVDPVAALPTVEGYLSQTYAGVQVALREALGRAGARGAARAEGRPRRERARRVISPDAVGLAMGVQS